MSKHESVEALTSDTQRKRVFNLIHQERQYQEAMAKLKNWSLPEDKSNNDWIAIMQHELDEAKAGYFKNFDSTKPTRDCMLHEILQVICVGVACLETIDSQFLQKMWDLSDPDNAEAKHQQDLENKPNKNR